MSAPTGMLQRHVIGKAPEQTQPSKQQGRKCALAMVTSSEVGKTVSTRPGRAGCWLQRLAAARCVGSRGRLDGRETRQFVELRRCLGRSATSARPRPSSPTRTKAVAHGANGEVVLGIGRTGLRQRPTQTQAKHFERDGGSGAPTWRPKCINKNSCAATAWAT